MFLGEPGLFLSFPRLAELTLPLCFLGHAAFLGPAAGFEQGRLVFSRARIQGRPSSTDARSTRSSTGSVGWPFQVAARPSSTWRVLGQGGGDAEPLAKQRGQRVVGQPVGRAAILAHPHVSQQVTVLAGFEQGIEPLRGLVRVAVVDLLGACACRPSPRGS